MKAASQHNSPQSSQPQRKARPQHQFRVILQQALGNPNGRDDFSTANNWTGFDNECFKSEVTGGQFVMTAKGKAGFSCWETTWPSVDNYYLQTNIVNPEACDADDRFGMFIRTPDLTAGYLVGLTCDGRLAMTKWDGENTDILVNFVSSEHINLGLGANNRLGVLAHGEYLSISTSMDT